MTVKIKRPPIRTQRIILVGSPNVGKSLLFNLLTHSYTTVSNYPGTSVDIFRGKAVIRGNTVEIVDTPGMYSFFALTEEERVARRILFDSAGALVLQVVDAKNLKRMLPLTLQLLEAGFQVILVLNMMDEAEKWGIEIDAGKLAGLLGIPVVPTTLVKKKGVTALKREILKALHGNKSLLKAPPLLYPPLFE
ncbi:MAG TPA: GTP-binding protein, partial [Firmicutes bacterium]|nr:GTP-binding protein [Bacillota bacterium]